MLLIVLLTVFAYGMYILFKGEYRISNKNLLTGKRARIIGVLFALAPFLSFLLANILYLVLLVAGIDITQNNLGSILAALAILAALLLLMIYLINSIASRLYARQAPAAKSDS